MALDNGLDRKPETPPFRKTGGRRVLQEIRGADGTQSLSPASDLAGP